VSDELAARVSGIGSLAEPARRALYLFVAGEADPVSREQAAAGVGLAVHTARFHLDRLVDEGLLEVEFRRLSGRTGPGAGRPSKLYRRSDREVAVSLPERRYDVAGRILAGAVDRAGTDDVPVRQALAQEAEEEGRRWAGEQAPDRADDEGSQLERVAGLLAEHGYEPRRTGQEIALANCPFHALVQEHPQLVCAMNLSLIGGVLDGLGCTALGAVLEPEEGMCCVRTRALTHDPGAVSGQ
jgi:predicted ArsR family transcriptional regulator